MPVSKFDECAEDYRAYRPEYPAELYDLLERKFRLTKDSVIVDVGAGTGKAAIAMAKRGWKIIAIELSREMIEQGKEAVSENNVEINYRHGTAENIPVKSSFCDLVTSAQAFHWFDPPNAFLEFQRILKLGGGVAIWWNSRNTKAAPYLQGLIDLIRKHNPVYTGDMWGHGGKNWGDIIEQSGLFSQIDQHTFSHDYYLTFDGFIGLVNSFSYVSTAMTPETRQQFFNELRPFLENQFPDGRCWIPYITNIWTAFFK